jgi:hypothetical protein
MLVLINKMNLIMMKVRKVSVFFPYFDISLSSITFIKVFFCSSKCANIMPSFMSVTYLISLFTSKFILLIIKLFAY